MEILTLIVTAFVVLSIYSWQRSRPKLPQQRRKRSGLNGQDPTLTSGAEASAMVVEAETRPQSTRPRCRTLALCLIDTISCCPSAPGHSQAG